MREHVCLENTGVKCLRVETKMETFVKHGGDRCGDYIC